MKILDEKFCTPFQINGHNAASKVRIIRKSMIGFFRKEGNRLATAGLKTKLPGRVPRQFGLS
jgi:hypothetical protein